MDDERFGIYIYIKRRTATQNFIRLGRGGTVVNARKSARKKYVRKSVKEKAQEEILRGGILNKSGTQETDGNLESSNPRLVFIFNSGFYKKDLLFKPRLYRLFK